MNPWAYVIGGITLYDSWLMFTGRDSLSHHYRTAARRRPVAVPVFTAYLIGHLYGALPTKVDIFSGYGKVLSFKKLSA